MIVLFITLAYLAGLTGLIRHSMRYAGAYGVERNTWAAVRVYWAWPVFAVWFVGLVLVAVYREKTNR